MSKQVISATETLSGNGLVPRNPMACLSMGLLDTNKVKKSARAKNTYSTNEEEVSKDPLNAIIDVVHSEEMSVPHTVGTSEWKTRNFITL